MSQPSHDTEVENVLSAIRRLIEEGGQGNDAPLDRLMLTPALRVPVSPDAPASAEVPLQPLGAASEPLVLLNALPVAAFAPPAIPPRPDEPIVSDDPGAEEGRAPDPLLPVEDPDLSDLSTDPGAAEAALARSEEPSLTEPPAPLEVTPLRVEGEEIPPAAAPLHPELFPAPAALAPEEPRSARPAGSPTPTTAPAWPDEAALRALVADVLRQELRGELGERLTRNLRKLVRQEVMQALALRDL